MFQTILGAEIHSHMSEDGLELVDELPYGLWGRSPLFRRVLRGRFNEELVEKAYNFETT